MLAFPLYFLLTYSCLVTQLTVLSEGKAIFILAGQSNMAGRGGVINNTWDGYVPIESAPNQSILRLDSALNWAEAIEPLHRDIDVTKTCGIGPGMAFAHWLLEKDSSIGVVGLVPCAIGGTNISEWARGGYLYGELVRRAEAAVQGGGEIKGMLWYQGESDTVNREDAELYKRRLARFFVQLRADLLPPQIPIIQVAIASGEGPYIDMVREGQLEIDLPNIRCIDAKGAPLEPDGLHLNTQAQVRLGELLANAFLQTLSSPLTNKASLRFTNFNSNSFILYLILLHILSRFFVMEMLFG